MRGSVKRNLYNLLDEIDDLEYDNLYVDNIHELFTDYYNNEFKYLSIEDRNDVIDYLMDEYLNDSPEAMSVIAFTPVVIKHSNKFKKIINGVLQDPDVLFTPKYKLINAIKAYVNSKLMSIDANTCFMLVQKYDDVIPEYRINIMTDYYSNIVNIDAVGLLDIPLSLHADDDFYNAGEEITDFLNDKIASGIEYDSLKDFISDIKKHKFKYANKLRHTPLNNILDLFTYRDFTRDEYYNYMIGDNNIDKLIIIFINELYEIILGYHDTIMDLIIYEYTKDSDEYKSFIETVIDLMIDIEKINK